MLKLPPPVWALIYVLVTAAVSYFAGVPRVRAQPIVLLGIAFMAAGVVQAVSAALLFRREGTELKPTSTSNARLVTSGPFRFTRNPMYLSLVFVTLGIALWVGAWPMLLAPVATFATLNWVHIPFEEAKMRRQYGEAFDAYVRSVRRWI